MPPFQKLLTILGPPISPRERTPFLRVYRNRVDLGQQEAAAVPRSSQQRAHCTWTGA